MDFRPGLLERPLRGLPEATNPERSRRAKSGRLRSYNFPDSPGLCPGVSGRSSGPAGSAAAVACGAHARVTTPHLARRFHLPLLLQQELTKKQAAELGALFRRKLEGQRNTSTGGALPPSWPGLGGVSATGRLMMA